VRSEFAVDQSRINLLNAKNRDSYMGFIGWSPTHFLGGKIIGIGMVE